MYHTLPTSHLSWQSPVTSRQLLTRNRCVYLDPYTVGSVKLEQLFFEFNHVAKSQWKKYLTMCKPLD